MFKWFMNARARPKNLAPQKIRFELSSAETKRLKACLDAKIGEPAGCPNCKNGRLALQPYLFYPVAVALNENNDPMHPMGDGPIYTKAMLICIGCGHSLFFNTHMIGFHLDSSDTQDGN